MEDKDRADGGAGSFGVGPSSAVSNTQKASSKVCSKALLWKNLICVVGMWFTSALSRCSGKTFTYKVKDREIVLSCLVLPPILFKTIS